MLTERQLKVILDLRKMGRSIREIADLTEIPKSTIGDCLSGKTYRQHMDRLEDEANASIEANVEKSKQAKHLKSVFSSFGPIIEDNRRGKSKPNKIKCTCNPRGSGKSLIDRFSEYETIDNTSGGCTNAFTGLPATDGLEGYYPAILNKDVPLSSKEIKSSICGKVDVNVLPKDWNKIEVSGEKMDFDLASTEGIAKELEEDNNKVHTIPKDCFDKLGFGVCYADSDKHQTWGERVFYPGPVEKPVRNVLVIGDLHLCFSKPGYLEFCKEIYDEYGCNFVIQIGDLVDNHYSSRFDSDPDGMSAGDELYKTKKELQRWYKVFPKVTVTLGNHCNIILRRAYASGISKHWVRDFNEVLGVPNWTFVPEIILDDILYRHGGGMIAQAKAGKEFMSVVQGHNHTLCNINYLTGAGKTIFSLQCPTGIDDTAYAFEYAKNFPRSAVGCAVILNNGTQPVIRMMP